MTPEEHADALIRKYEPQVDPNVAGDFKHELIWRIRNAVYEECEASAKAVDDFDFDCDIAPRHLAALLAKAIRERLPKPLTSDDIYRIMKALPDSIHA